MGNWKWRKQYGLQKWTFVGKTYFFHFAYFCKLIFLSFPQHESTFFPEFFPLYFNYNQTSLKIKSFNRLNIFYSYFSWYTQFDKIKFDIPYIFLYREFFPNLCYDTNKFIISEICLKLFFICLSVKQKRNLT